MKPFRLLIIALLLLPLTVGAETVTWTPAVTYTDGSVISIATQSIMTFYLRIRRVNSTVVTYFGETRNGVSTWTDNILVRANANGVTPPLVAGDNVIVTLSQSYLASDGIEYDSAQSPGVTYMIPKAAPPPPAKPPSCAAPTNVTIRP